jgi:cbb3-type cytochrome oxidase cytochrome c subunit
MNYGPLVFLGVFATMITSWFGMIFVPQLQLGQLHPVAADVSGGLYPAAMPGQAQQGAMVYRQEGCYYCHSQQVRQNGVVFDVILLAPGENTNDVAAVVAKHGPNPDLANLTGVLKLIQNPPYTVATKVPLEQAEKILKEFDGVFAFSDEGKPKAYKRIDPAGPDLDRNWGIRRSVAEDYLFAKSVTLGEQRIGPDLTNVGLRRPFADWHYLHLYQPDSAHAIPGSKMPAYKFLFETRRIGLHPSPDALKLPEGVVEQGWEVVPKPAAKSLVAYLLNLKTTTPTFDAPMPPVIKKPEPAATTNAVTNAVPAK